MTHHVPISKTRLLAQVTRLFSRQRSGTAPAKRRPQPSLDKLSRRIILPSIPVTEEEMTRVAFQDLGQKLARQEMWSKLSDRIIEADRTRSGTPGGESAAMLMGFGARNDVVAMAEDSLHDGVIPDHHGIDALDRLAEDHPDDYPVHAIVALAHVDMARAWRSVPGAAALSGADDRAAHHTARAQSLLASYSASDLDAPSLAAAQCALLRAAPDATALQVADEYEQLIDLDPASPPNMRALGATVLAVEPGNFPQLELEARRIAVRTASLWGAGGYTWVYLDALALDSKALALLDPAFFIDGLRDILRRCPDQNTANLMAAFCAVTMRAGDDPGAAHEAVRTALHDCLTWILRDHLHELHPLIWTQALHCPGAGHLPPRRALISEGRSTALSAIAAQFADDIARGQSIAFSPAGMYMLPSL
ncbi:hypothetical protein ACEWPM_002615 [Roseovarius sp. S4756]|uniref:hypothetical protein n=1 Tax=Roseovarius maritimus TaxID=3342637 RepID=UPI00372CAD6B